MDYSPFIYPAAKWVVITAAVFVGLGILVWIIWLFSKWIGILCGAAAIALLVIGISVLPVMDNVKEMVYPSMNAEIYRLAIEGDSEWAGVAEDFYAKPSVERAAIENQIRNRNTGLAEIGMTYHLYDERPESFRALLLATIARYPIILVFAALFYGLPASAVALNFLVERKRLGTQYATVYAEQHNKYEKMAAQLERQLTQARNDLKDANTNVEDKRHEYDEISAECTKQKNELDSYNKDKDSVQAEIERLRRIVTTNHKEIDSQYADYKKLKYQELSRWEIQYKEQRRQAKEQELYNELIEKVKQDVGDVRSKGMEEIKAINAAVQDKEEQVKAMNQEITEAQQTLSSIQSEKEKAEQQLEAVKEEIKKKQDEDAFL